MSVFGTLSTLNHRQDLIGVAQENPSFTLKTLIQTYPITQSLMWKKTEVVFYFQSCYLPTWIANGIPNKTWTDFAFVVGVFFFGLSLETICYINIHDFEQPHFCFNRFLSVRKLQRVRETLWMLPAHHTVRDTLRAAYITHTLWEWEKPWELLIHIKHLESERNLESCLHHTLWEWETLWELPASHLESERHPESCLHHNLWECEKTLRQLPSETLCESFTWRDFLWALV